MSPARYKKERDPQFEDKWVDSYGACEYMSVTMPWLYKEVARGSLPHVKVNGRMLRFKLSDLEAYMQRNHVLPTQASVSQPVEETDEEAW